MNNIQEIIKPFVEVYVEREEKLAALEAKDKKLEQQIEALRRRQEKILERKKKIYSNKRYSENNDWCKSVELLAPELAKHFPGFRCTVAGPFGLDAEVKIWFERESMSEDEILDNTEGNAVSTQSHV